MKLRIQRAMLAIVSLASSVALLWMGLALAEPAVPGGNGAPPVGGGASLGTADGSRVGGPGSQRDYEDPFGHPAYFEAGPFLEGYEFNEMPLEPGNPFYPSSATTRGGDFYSRETLMAVERCSDAGCHPDIYAQWYESTHHLASFNDPWYRRTFEFFEERSGQQNAQWCGGCHDPAVMMTGNMQGRAPIDFESAAANVGITCQFCHSVGLVHPTPQNGSYQLAPSAPLPYEGTTDPDLRQLGNQMLLGDPELIQRHKADRMKPFLLLGEFCGACHKQSLITPVNNYKWLRGFDELDGWQNSGIPFYSARSFYYPEEPMICQSCHMPEVPSDDAGNDDGMVNSHRFLGANTALSSFHGYGEQLLRTAEFLADERVSVDLFMLRVPVASAGEARAAAAGEASRMPVGDAVPGRATGTLVAPAEAFEIAVAPGAEIEVEVVVRTKGVGHGFPGGTIDSNMVWLEITVFERDGRPLLMSGGMGEDGFVDPDAHFYRGVFLDEAGQELTKRNGWDRRAAVYARMIPPGAADTIHYRFRVPEETRGTLRVRARVNYRKHRQAYNRWAMGAEPAARQPAEAVSEPRVDTRVWVYDDRQVPELPTVVMAEDELTLGVIDEPAHDSTAPAVAPPGARRVLVDGAELAGDRLALEHRHWMRFNDYGIGLLRQQDLRGARRAFGWVQRVHPGYADGYVNEARAHIQEGSLAEGEAALERALEVQPNFLKAEYFRSRVLTGYGEYERAIELLNRVKQEFPYDRQVRIDLGRLYYLLGRYDEAVGDLLATLAIDPEELAAHYTLMLAYRAMGEEEKARIHESRYRRYREDEDIMALTGPFKLANPGANREAQAVHIHVLQPPGDRFSSADRFPVAAFLEGGPHFKPPTVFAGPQPPWLRER